MVYYNRYSLNRYSDLLISLTCEGIFVHPVRVGLPLQPRWTISCELIKRSIARVLHTLCSNIGQEKKHNTHQLYSYSIFCKVHKTNDCDCILFCTSLGILTASKMNMIIARSSTTLLGRSILPSTSSIC